MAHAVFAEGPNFLCVGMPKAGTGWLFYQLYYHSDFWMPPLKELHYLNGKSPTTQLRTTVELARVDPKRLAKQRARKNLRQLSKTDLAFLDDLSAFGGRDADIEAYRSLFRHKHQLLSGDVTPAYCVLDAKTVSRVANRIPQLKIILLLRDPVSRAWSRLSTFLRQDQAHRECLANENTFRHYFEKVGDSPKYLATISYLRWREALPASQIKYWFLEDIAGDPRKERADILTFLGADASKPSGDLEAGYNRKASAEKIEMPAFVRDFLIQYFENEMRSASELFGAKAGRWLTNYGLNP